MMTAAGIAKGLDLPKFHVNYIYSELMSEHMFDTNPLKKTVLSSKSKEHIVQQYLDGVDFEHGTVFKEEAQKLYPESK